MKPVWFVQHRPNDHETTTQRLIYVIQEMGMEVFVEKYVPFGGMDYAFLPEDKPVVFSGAIAVVKDIKRRFLQRFFPFAWFDDSKLSCRHYYTYWGPYLLQEIYGFYTLAEIVRLQLSLYQLFGDKQCIFIRPDENDKEFTGELVHKDKFHLWVEQAYRYNPPPELLCVVSKPQKVDAEWRLVIADNKVITGSQYRLDGMIEKAASYPEDAKLFAETVAKTWSPHPTYCLDIAATPYGYRVVECGSLNCAGFYEMDLRAIVTAMSEIAEREWSEACQCREPKH